MELIEEIRGDLEKTLTKDRYNHSLGVMKRAGELAKIYNIDVNLAETVGLAHDIAKEMTSGEKIAYTRKNRITIDEVERENTTLLHGKIGADICKKRYNFTKQMQDAIIYHTTTDPRMDMLAKIIYVADKTEENRNSTEYNVQYERDLADADIDAAIIYIINENVKALLARKRLIHPKSIETRNRLMINRKKMKKSISKHSDI